MKSWTKKESIIHIPWWKRRGYGQIDPISLSQIRTKPIKLPCGHFLSQKSYDKISHENNSKCPLCRSNL
jgi:hypothetical protein